MATDEELEARAEERIKKAAQILREDGIIANLNKIKKHLNITDEPPVDPNAPPAPPKKDKKDDPPVDPPNEDEGKPKRRHWLYGEIYDGD